MNPTHPRAGRTLSLTEQRLADVRSAAASCAGLGVAWTQVEAEARIGWQDVVTGRQRPAPAAAVDNATAGHAGAVVQLPVRPASAVVER